MRKIKHNQYELVIDGSTGLFYVNDRLMFKGFSYVAISMFIRSCDNPNVTEKFRAQLEMREKPKFKEDRSSDNKSQLIPKKK
jgi:hypothetical protein